MPNRLPVPAMDFCGLTTSCYTYMFYNWQALLAGMAAIVAALIAGRFVRRQIAYSERQEAGRLSRRELAARAVLPLTLTKFTDFADQCATVLRAVNLPMGAVPKEVPAIPQQAISDLERAIEAASDEGTVATMSRLAGHTQVLHSIISDVVADSARGSSIAKHRLNMPAFEMRTARVYAAAAKLYPWARGEADTTEEVSWDDVETGLSLLNIGDDQTTDLIRKAAEKGKKPLDW